MTSSKVDEGTTNKVGKSKFGIILLSVVTLIIVFLISIMKVLGNDWWQSFYDVFRHAFELLYFSSGVVLIVGLYIGYKQLEITNRDIRIRNERAAVDKSLDYLNFFAETLLPKADQYFHAMREVDHLGFERWDPKLNNYKLDVFALNDELQLKMLDGLVTRQEKGIQDIFNQLEFFSAGILHGLAKEEVVYDPLSGVFCKLVDMEMITLCALRSQGSPYENLLELYKKWNLRKENDAKLLQIAEAEHTIKLAKQQVAAGEESTKPQKPIGFQ